ncbi:hypothetical protein B7P43_G07708 [Cryptotermes secundus]|uniref:Gustatory receptor n=1 Tax=Cryptotermes secundus TaxID=105785 RepID=A0A2J7PHV3_9NEOP|nr:hypothetical protein B7P43_G07708 [Cryptotermes secundus]
MKCVSRATDIYSAVWPLHFISRIFGLAPYSLKPGAESAKCSTFVTCLCRTWSILCIIFVVALEYFYMTGIIIKSSTLKHKVTSILFFASMCSCSIINIFQSLIIIGVKLREILHKFSEIDQRFSSKVYRSLIYKNTSLFFTLQFATVILVVIIINVLLIYVSKGYLTFIHIFSAFFLSVPALVNCTAILHFVNLVLLLRNKYKYLNSELESSALSPCNITNSEYCNTNYVTPIDTFRMKPSFNEQRGYRYYSRRQHFRNLRIIYSQLHDVALLINSTYGFSLLCATVWMFCSVIPTANNLIEMKPTNIYGHIITTVLWSIYYFALIGIMAMSCSLAVNECSRSPLIVQKIMLRDDIDSEVMKELEMMFTQFKAMKIEFSACDMYRIDLQFLCGIISGSFSYVIIVMQL